MRKAPLVGALVGVSTLACVATLAAPARAQDAPVLAELEWKGGPAGSNCIARDELEAAVEARLGRTLFAPKGQGDVHVSGGIAAEDDKWLVRMTLTSAQGEPMGERELESESTDCSALDDSLALVLAVMLDIPKTRIPAPTAKGATNAPSEPTPSPARKPAPVSKLRVPKDTPPRRPRWRFQVGLSGAGTLGLLPEFSFGVRGHVAVKPPEFWKVGIDVGAYTSVDESIGSEAAGASFSPKEVGVFVCPLEVPLSRMTFEGCLVQHIGTLHVEGYGFDTNEEQERPYVNLGLALAAGLQIIGPLSVRVGIDAQAPMLRETFRYGSQTGEEPSLFQMAPVLVAGQIGVAADF